MKPINFNLNMFWVNLIKIVLNADSIWVSIITENEEYNRSNNFHFTRAVTMRNLTLVSLDITGNITNEIDRCEHAASFFNDYKDYSEAIVFKHDFKLFLRCKSEQLLIEQDKVFNTICRLL